MPYLISIVGPTASGKSALAVSLSKEWLQVPVISADSVQVYAGMEIGSGQVTSEETQGVPHYMLSLYPPTHKLDAASYADSVKSILNHHFEHHAAAIMVGGSGLYLQAVWEGFDDIPRIDERVREQLKAELDAQGLPPLVEELRRVDAETWHQVDRQNPARVLRALEVWRGTGKPISHFRGGSKREPNPWEDVKIGLEWDRQELYRRIEERVEAMMAQGWLEEAKTLVEAYGMDCKGLQVLGYRELLGHLKGEMGLGEAVALIKQNTRRFSKRQMTWFKRFPDIRWFSPMEEEAIKDYLKSRCQL